MLLFNVEPTGEKVSNRKDPSHRIIEVNHEIAKERYYAHRRLKEYMPVDGAKRLIDCPYKSFEEIPGKYPRKYVATLLRLGYTIQYKLL